MAHQDVETKILDTTPGMKIVILDTALGMKILMLDTTQSKKT
jgi:hypothetical protein